MLRALSTQRATSKVLILSFHTDITWPDPTMPRWSYMGPYDLQAVPTGYRSNQELAKRDGSGTLATMLSLQATGKPTLPSPGGDGDWVLLRASKDAKLAEDSEGTGPTTMECPGLAGQRQTQPLPMDPSSKIRPGVLTTPR